MRIYRDVTSIPSSTDFGDLAHTENLVYFFESLKKTGQVMPIVFCFYFGDHMVFSKQVTDMENEYVNVCNYMEESDEDVYGFSISYFVGGQAQAFVTLCFDGQNAEVSCRRSDLNERPVILLPKKVLLNPFDRQLSAYRDVMALLNII